jgi:glyoxylase-like metal-dependent hydrolase (beta-lactamase superfamily II)
MRVHHLNCGTLRPAGGRYTDGRSPVLARARLVCHCLLAESDAGLVLVDTGFGCEDIAATCPRLSRLRTALLRPALDPAETARAQVEALGYSQRDVRHIVLTHLDFDHAGGVRDFPLATVHVYEDELIAAMAAHGSLARARYRSAQWGGGVRWRAYRLRGDRWHAFEAVRDLEGLPPEFLLVPLPGHTRGHCGVAVRGEGRWLLHAGDAYHHRGELDAASRCPPLLRGYEWLTAADRRAALANRQRLRDLAARDGGLVDIFCAHDAVEFEQRAASLVLRPYGASARERSRYSRSAR